jgi:hypothetical protein
VAEADAAHSTRRSAVAFGPSVNWRARPGPSRLKRWGALVAVTLVVSAPVRAQTFPSGPIVLAEGNVTIGGNASVTLGPEDPGFFNYADYDRSLLRLLQIAFTGSARAGEHLTVLAHVRTQNDTADVPALYLRIRPWTTRAIDIQVGRIPPTFGAFSRRAYGPDNPLIGYPLAYQYLTSLRADALPATSDELLAMRGRGWLSSFTVGNPTPAHGMPLVSALRWDTGIQVHAAGDLVEVAGAVTAGTVSDPRWRVPDGLRQLAGRVGIRPVPGLVVGASVARGPFITGAAAEALPDSVDRRSFMQTAWGADIEYSRDYYLVRAEFVGTRWRLPELTQPVIREPLTAIAASVEGRYKLRPGLFAAARLDRLAFSEVTGSTRRAAWDAPVSRVEVGAGYLFLRNLQLKVSYQHNTRDTARNGTFDAGAAQLMFWF